MASEHCNMTALHYGKYSGCNYIKGGFMKRWIFIGFCLLERSISLCWVKYQNGLILAKNAWRLLYLLFPLKKDGSSSAVDDKDLDPDSIYRCCRTSDGNPIVEIRQSNDRLISTMGFPILVRRYLYIESGPCLSCVVNIIIVDHLVTQWARASSVM